VYPDTYKTLVAGLVFLELAGELAAARAGHDDVREEKVDHLGVLSRRVERLLGICAIEDLVAEFSRASPWRVDAAPRRPRQAGSSRCRRLWKLAKQAAAYPDGIDAREIDLERGAPPGFRCRPTRNRPTGLTIPYTVDNPSPVPLPFSLVVKNGSKIRALASGVMPVPVSLTASMT